MSSSPLKSSRLSLGPNFSSPAPFEVGTWFAGGSPTCCFTPPEQSACGYRNRENFQSAIYFHLGGLDLYAEALKSAHSKS